MKTKTISLIVTCYREAENIVPLYTRVVSVFKTLPSYDFELIYVDNASDDNSAKLIKRLGKKDKRVKGIFMTRNFGSPQPSFIAGLSYATGDAAVPMHGDIQDPPEVIPKFIKQWEDGYDVVYGVRKQRDGYNAIWNVSYRAFYWLLSKLAYVDIPLDAGEFSLMDKRVVSELLALDEYEYYLRCLRAFVGFRQTGVTYKREKRARGNSTENYLRGLWWAKTIIVNFSFKPLTIISYLGLAVTCMAFVFILINLYLVLFLGQREPGAPTIVIIVLFLGGVQLLSLSIIAEYIAKIFLEVKRRPRYIVGETMNIRKQP